MIRTIKFRAFDSEINQYRKSGQIQLSSNGTPFILIPIQISEDVSGLQCEEIENIIIEQFTGLKDKNGIEIYEGDIQEYFEEVKNFDDDDILNPRNHFMAQYSTKKRTLIVEFKDGFFHALTNASIIGNIHENPELIKA